jgi:hypothetical protein
MLRSSLLVALLAGAACGLGPFSDEGGGADNLPSLGAGPYRLLEADFDTPADEPYVHAQQVVSLLDPAVLERDDQGFDIFYSKLEEGTSEIWHVGLPDIHELVDTAPRRVLQADAPWEEGNVGGAALLVDGDRLILYYHGGTTSPAIGRAVSTDGGNTFVKDAANPIVDEGMDPHVVLFEESWLMVHVDAEQQRILLRESENGINFSTPPARELLAARSGIDFAFDQLGLRGPVLDLRKTLDGGLHYGLFYTGLGRGDPEAIEAIGYVGSFDSVLWERFLEGEPILQAGPTGGGGAAPVIGGSSSLLFFHQLRQGRGRIGVATSP